MSGALFAPERREDASDVRRADGSRRSGAWLRTTWPLAEWRQAIVLRGCYLAMTIVWAGVGLLLRNPFDGTAIVRRLEPSAVISSFPSGHVAAATAYGAIAVVVFWHTRNRLARSIAVIVCAAIPVVVAYSRMYRGMHFLTDVVAGVLLGATSLVITTMLLARTREAAHAEGDQAS